MIEYQVSELDLEFERSTFLRMQVDFLFSLGHFLNVLLLEGYL